MTLEIKDEVLDEIHAHAESAYPEEGAGLMLGKPNGNDMRVLAIVKLANAREDEARHNRYLITPQDYLRGEQMADGLGLEVIGVFHSHPDHPNRPSEFDREWAWPWLSYVITSVFAGRAVESRAWRLQEDRGAFEEEIIEVIDDQ
ncbi:MAG TPA: M67 family metallopeptidase [Anaerolineales bacterium]